MTGRTNHSKSAPLVARHAAQVAPHAPRAAVLIAEWRHLEKLATGAPHGPGKEALIKQRDAALNAVREAADSYLAKGHP